MKNQEQKDIHLLGVADGYELEKVLPNGGLASRIVINRFLKEQTHAYRLGLMKGIEKRKEKALKSRNDALKKDESYDNSLTNFKIHYGPDHDMEH